MSTDWGSDRISCVVATVIAFISFLCSLYVFSSIWLMRIIRNKYNAKQQKGNVILNTHIYYVSICGIFNYGLLTANFAPFAITGTKGNIYGVIPCKLIGFIVQMAPICEAMWFCLISITINMILHHKWTILYLNTNLKYHHVMVWGVGLIFGIIPWTTNAYGISSVEWREVDGSNAEETATQCWIMDQYKGFFLTLYIPILIMMILDIYCLLKAYKVIRYIKEKSLSMYILKKCYLFVLIYVLIWIPPMVLRFIQISKDDWNIPFWFLLIHHINISLSGILTAIIWGSTESFIPCYIGLCVLCCNDRFTTTNNTNKHGLAIWSKHVSCSPQTALLDSAIISNHADHDCSSFQNVYKVKALTNNKWNEEDVFLKTDDIIQENKESISEMMPSNEAISVTIENNKDDDQLQRRKTSKTTSTLRKHFDSDGLESTDSN